MLVFHDKIHSFISLFLFSTGITNTIGRVLTGAIADLRKVDSLIINNISLIITGLATALSPLCKSYMTLCIYTAVFGFNAGKSLVIFIQSKDKNEITL